MIQELIKLCDAYYLCVNADRRTDRENIVLPEPLDELARYVNQGYYIHFSNHRDLIGINPNYLGPNLQGIFTFYLDEQLFNKIASGSSSIKTTRPFIQIIAPRNPNILDTQTYSANDLYRDMSSLERFFPDKAEQLKMFNERPAKTLMKNITEIIAPTSNSLQNRALQMLGYTAIRDRGDNVLFSSKGAGQTVFLAKKYIDVVDTLDNPLAKEKLVAA